MFKKYCLMIEDFASNCSTVLVVQNFHHSATQFLAVKATKQRSMHDEFYGVGFMHVRNSNVFRL